MHLIVVMGRRSDRRLTNSLGEIFGFHVEGSDKCVTILRDGGTHILRYALWHGCIAGRGDPHSASERTSPQSGQCRASTRNSFVVKL